MGGRTGSTCGRRSGHSVFLGNVAPDTAAGPALAVAEATHFVLALSQDLGEGIRLGLEGFYKEFEGLHADAGPDDGGVGRRHLGAPEHRQLHRLAGLLAGMGLVGGAGPAAARPGVLRPAPGDVRRVRAAHRQRPFDVRVSYGAGLPYTAVPEPPVASPSFSVAGGEPATNLQQ
jgi:hypothetical protein